MTTARAQSVAMPENSSTYLEQSSSNVILQGSVLTEKLITLYADFLKTTQIQVDGSSLYYTLKFITTIKDIDQEIINKLTKTSITTSLWNLPKSGPMQPIGTISLAENTITFDEQFSIYSNSHPYFAPQLAKELQQIIGIITSTQAPIDPLSISLEKTATAMQSLQTINQDIESIQADINAHQAMIDSLENSSQKSEQEACTESKLKKLNAKISLRTYLPNWENRIEQALQALTDLLAVFQSYQHSLQSADNFKKDLATVFDLSYQSAHYDLQPVISAVQGITNYMQSVWETYQENGMQPDTLSTQGTIQAIHNCTEYVCALTNQQSTLLKQAFECQSVSGGNLHNTIVETYKELPQAIQAQIEQEKIQAKIEESVPLSKGAQAEEKASENQGVDKKVATGNPYSKGRRKVTVPKNRKPGTTPLQIKKNILPGTDNNTLREKRKADELGITAETGSENIHPETIASKAGLFQQPAEGKKDQLNYSRKL